jgi:lipoprotein-anchoring transpeptidase ErfK/SrfK
LGGRTARWQGEPTTETVLPLRLGQGESEALVVDDARGDSGSWLSRRITMEVYAPEALQVVALWPTDGAERIPPRADPTFRFSEAITDREAAEKAIRFDPPVPGRFEWLAPNRVRFLPETRFPSETPISMEVVHGLDGVRGESGSFLTSAVRAGFTTGKMKVIDVSLSGQRIALIEEGQTVWSAPVATGVRGAETPPGTYEVQYKMATARFRGSNPDGSRYDIPNVHWVLAFYGDYTIHGAWWRNVFGRPGSAGCISMTDANAKVVFDWADVGTPVVVRG